MSTDERLVSVNVLLQGSRPGKWRTEWRQISAGTLEAAVDKALAMPDVKQVYEASWIPGGVLT
jgi:hypothetical protein